MAKRYDRPSRYGWTVVTHHSRNQLGLISLDGLDVLFTQHGAGPLEHLRGRNGSFRFEQDADLRYRHTVTLEASA